MRSRRRILAASLAALVALAFGVLLLVLRYGRPLYYSDGVTGQAGASLRQASMLEFGEARVLAEFPGAIVGRVARLPDGRWIFGLRSDEGRVDLVAQDPKRPGLPPEVLLGLNSDGLDFAPAMGPGPALYFVSDRPGGQGGLDLYRSEWRQGSFGPVRALRVGINSDADESDPAPASSGTLSGSLVFVRKAPGGEHSQLCLASIKGEADAKPLFPQWESPTGRSLLRDPIFGGSGQSLYFVRRTRKGVSLLRTALHQGRFLQPWLLSGVERHVGWRSPLPGEHGLSIDLLRPGKPALLYRSHAEERLVFWEGQRDLERLLLVGLLFSGLLVVLITLGGRWSQLDLLTKLLLLSLLIHGLILLWMSRVDIMTRNEEQKGEEGTIQIQILSQEANDTGGQGRMEPEPAKDLVFEARHAQLQVEGPRSELAEAEIAPRDPRSEERTEFHPQDRPRAEESARLADAADAPKPRNVAEDLAGLKAPARARSEQAPVRGLAREVQADRHESGVLRVRVPRTSTSLQEANRSTRSRHTDPTMLPLPTRASPDMNSVALQDTGAAEGRALGALARKPLGESATALSAGDLGGGGPTEPAVVAVESKMAPQNGRAKSGPGLGLSVPTVPGSALVTPHRQRRHRASPAAKRVVVAAAPGMAVVAEAEIHSSPERRRGFAQETVSSLGSVSVPARDPVVSGAARIGHPERRQESLSPKFGAPAPPGTLLTKAPRTRHEARAASRDPRPDVFRNRFGTARVEALRRFGGTKKTEAAVRSGLAYLARAQKSDGSWGNKAKVDGKYGETFVGKTGLCLLAFLGAGHVPGKGQKHSKTARMAMEFLLYVQDEETGHFGLSSAYSHGITTYALAECYALSREKKLRTPLDSAVAWILRNQNTSRDRRQDGGWGYYSSSLRSEDGYARTSVSSWQVMALLSAQKAGIEVPKSALDRARGFFTNSYDRRRGYYLYSREPQRLRSRWRTLPASTPASVFSLLLLGEKKDSDRIEGGLGFTLARRPRRYRWRGDDAFVREAEGNTYFWYYGSLACFLAGGETWKQWNQSLAAVLPQAQLEDGSFKPLGPYARYAGDDKRDRSYTTAMCVLSLEVYYRYFTPLLRGRR